MASSKLRLIILGAPGSGKGTISKRIVKDFRLNHLSSGDILRKNIENKTEIGVAAKDLIKHGKLLPDELITDIMFHEIKRVANASWLLDGFPRTLQQAKSLDTSPGGHVDRVINLNVPKDVIISRLAHRWLHPGSGRVYNLDFNPPKVPKKDDVTGEPLIQRDDDKKEVVLARLNVYEQQTKPLIEYYNGKQKLETFTGDTSDYLWPLIKAHLHYLEGTVKEADKPKRYVMKYIDKETHTGQIWDVADWRNQRFVNVKEKHVNPNVAMDLVAKDPVVVADQRVVWSSSGGALGHPRVYINIDRNEVHDCGYSGRRFIQKKFYDEKKHGPCISFEEYLADMERRERLEY